MLHRFVVFLSLACTTAALASPATPAAETTTPTPTPTTMGQAWRGSMDALAAVLSVVLPDAIDAAGKNGPVDAARAARLRQNVQALRAVAHNLTGMTGADLPDADPTLGIVVKELGKSADDLDKTAADRLPQVALSLVSTCIACHTRTAGPAARAGLAPVDAGLAADVRADIFAATRRFDDARVAYRAVVFDEAFASKDPWRWERAVRRALAVEVRVAGDAPGAAGLVEQVLATPGGDALWTAADSWKVDVAAWRSEPSGEAPFARAARLMNQVLQSQRPAGDVANEVLLLRATGALHALLSSAPSASSSASSSSSALTSLQRAQALSWLGLAYERLNELDVWGLFLFYDAACVEAAPHTPLAWSCFERYRRASFELFSGNSGAPLPDELQPAVARLRLLAAPR